MAVSTADDELFTRAISSFRDYFLVQHAHLPESERNQLWTQRLSQFMAPSSTSDGTSAASGDSSGTTTATATTTANSRQGGSSSDNLGKRTRQDVPRTIPGAPSPAKRRATVCLLGPSRAPSFLSIIRFHLPASAPRPFSLPITSLD